MNVELLKGDVARAFYAHGFSKAAVESRLEDIINLILRKKDEPTAKAPEPVDPVAEVKPVSKKKKDD